MDKCNAIIIELLNSILKESCDISFLHKIKKAIDIRRLKELITADLKSFSQRDPAARNEPKNILFGYTSFDAVLHYRLAHAVYNSNLPRNLYKEKYQYALSISAKGKLKSGAEIHPAAVIGNRFILDHGFGTVIGETTEIGNDCYILGGVILGAMGISDNNQIKRHPKIGNNVQIGSFSRVLGTVVVGNNVFIGTNCTIIKNIPNDSIVTLKSETQIIKRNIPYVLN